MQHYFRLLVVLSVVASIYTTDSSAPALPKMQYTRTALHVSRSLNPDTTQLLHVKTRAGDVATLIVKKRDGKQANLPPTPPANGSKTDAVFRENKSTETAEKPLEIETRKFQRGNVRFLPPPVDIRSEEQFVKSASEDLPSHAESYGKSRSSDAKSSKTIRGHAVPEVKVPAPVFIRSMPMFVKGEREDEVKRGRSLMKIDSDGIPVIHGVRMPDDESDKQVWRNARVINGVLVPNEKPGLVLKKDNKKTAPTIFGAVPLERREDNTNSFAASHIEKLVPLYRFPSDSQADSSIMNFIRTINQREMTRNGNTKPRARMLQFPGGHRAFENEENTAFQPQENSNVKFPSRRSDDNLDAQEFQPRMLHYGSPIYPTSLLYTPQSKKPARSSFEEGVRTPVLQYAHPELGVQPARLQPKSAKAVTDGSGKINAAALAMFQQDLHSDRSPYVGMETEIDTDTNDNKRSSDGTPKNNFYQTTTQENTHNKNFAYDNQNYEFPKKIYYNNQDSYGLSNDDYIKRYPYDNYNSVNSYNAYSGPYLVKVVERPFWEQITDTIRDHVQTGMDRVSDMTRPVVEPLIEASHKISKNLGFSQRSSGIHELQEKVGGAVGTYPVLLPALGLVAGGAALGLGAVAVGRYLDVDMMRKQRSEHMDVEPIEHKRAMEALGGGDWVPVVVEEPVAGSDKPVAEGRSFPDAEGAQEGSWIIVEQLGEEPKGNLKKSDEEEKADLSEREGKSGSWVELKDVKDHGILQLKEVETNYEKVKEGVQLPESLRSEKSLLPPTEDKQDKWVSVALEEIPSANTPLKEVTSQGHRKKRATENDFMADILQTIETSTSSGLEHLEHHSDWSNTPCSKKLFCETMIKQSEDSILLMEKKMATFLNLIVPNSAVSYHLGDVMDAVKRHDCSSFACLDRPKYHPR